MGMISKINNFEKFIRLNESSVRKLAIQTAVDKLKERYGDNNDKFLESVKEKGVDEIQGYINKILFPFLKQIAEQEKNPNGQLKFDFDGLLSGLVCWNLVELELQIIKNQKPE